MARLPYVDPAEAPPHVREALEGLPPLNIFRTLAHAETAFRPYLRFGAAILGELQLDPKLRELAVLQVAHVAEAEYEWVQHVAIGRHVGVTDDQIAALEQGDHQNAERFDETERAVLAFTAEVVRGPHVTDETYAAVAERLSPREIVELLLTAGSYLMLARVMTALEIDVDPPSGSAVVDSVERGR
jgi:4-carboxymuconolactone decarboxylase